MIKTFSHLYKFRQSVHPISERMVCSMNRENQTNNTKNVYDDGNIPKEDLPQNKNVVTPVEPLPESTRPRKDGPGGN